MVIVWEPLKVIHQAIISRSCSLGGNRLVVVRVLDRVEAHCLWLGGVEIGVPIPIHSTI